MRISTIKYTVQQGLRNIVKNKMFSIASVATMVACIFLFGVFYALIANVQGIMRNIEESMPVMVYFEEETTKKEKDKIEKKLAKQDGVIEVKYVSGEEAWESYKQEYFGEDADALTGFEENPLVNSDRFEVYMSSVDNQNGIIEYAGKLDGVRKVRSSAEAAEVVKNVSVLLATLSGVITAVLLVVAIFLISNTVSMGITIRREEIAIMKYIGAKDSFVRAPFVFEGILIGLVGATIPLLLLYFVYQAAVNSITENYGALLSFIEFLPVSQVYATLLPIGLALGVGIGLIGSTFTIRKHLKA